MTPRGLKVALAMVGATALAGCGQQLPVTHSETTCINPGEKVSLKTTTTPGSVLSYKVQDDFGGDLGSLGPVTVGSDGTAETSWQSPAQMSTTTLHFILSAAKGNLRASQDIHVVVGGNGRHC